VLACPNGCSDGEEINVGDDPGDDDVSEKDGLGGAEVGEWGEGGVRELGGEYEFSEFSAVR